VSDERHVTVTNHSSDLNMDFIKLHNEWKTEEPIKSRVWGFLRVFQPKNLCGLKQFSSCAVYDDLNLSILASMQMRRAMWPVSIYVASPSARPFVSTSYHNKYRFGHSVFRAVGIAVNTDVRHSGRLAFETLATTTIREITKIQSPFKMHVKNHVSGRLIIHSLPRTCHRCNWGE